MNDLICWHDGDFKLLNDVHISPLDFGFIHSDATYDVLRVKNGKILFTDLHLNRFYNSCSYFGFNIGFDILSIAEKLIEKNSIDNAFLWLTCWRGIPPSGSPRDVTAPQHSLVYVKPYYGISNDGLNLCIDAFHRRTPDVCHDQQYKNFGWIEFNMAQRMAVAQGFDTALLLTVDGHISEGPGFGVCFVKDGVVITPNKDCLKSVTIDVVEQICKTENIQFQRKDITVEEMHMCEEAFICSTSGGITPIKKIENTHYSHDLTNELKLYYDNIQS
jgi:branched-chain amino acid aminotransferase